MAIEILFQKHNDKESIITNYTVRGFLWEVTYILKGWGDIKN
jgi:hypothetical protein